MKWPWRSGNQLHGWRRVASALWDSPNDPQIYGALDIDAAPLQAYIAAARELGRRITPTHLVGRAVAHALECVPDLNVRIRRGRAYARPTIDIFFITAVAAGRDLSGVKITDLGSKSALDLADELAQRAAALKQGRDPDLARSKALIDKLPPRALRGMLRATAYLAEDLALDLPGIGLKRAPFGSAMVTSVGMFGLPQGFVPLAWMYDVPLLVLVGEITPRAVVVGGRVEPREVLPITATIDHRYVDGWHVSAAMKAFRDYLADPSGYEPAMPTVARVPSTAPASEVQRSRS